MKSLLRDLEKEICKHSNTYTNTITKGIDLGISPMMKNAGKVPAIIYVKNNDLTHVIPHNFRIHIIFNIIFSRVQILLSKF